MSFDFATAGSALLHLFIAFLLALPVAWERERSTRRLGLRTFPLVAVASCAYVLLGSDVTGDEPHAQSRVLQGLMTGIGFIGGGAILKQGANVRGTATAASLWTTGAVGAAVAAGRLEIAVMATLITFLTLRILTPLEKMVVKIKQAESEPTQAADDQGD